MLRFSGPERGFCGTRRGEMVSGGEGEREKSLTGIERIYSIGRTGKNEGGLIPPVTHTKGKRPSLMKNLRRRQECSS